VGFDWRDCFRCGIAFGHADFGHLDGGKEPLRVSGQSVCGDWKASNAWKCSRRPSEAHAASGATLRGRRDLLLAASPTLTETAARLLTCGPLHPAFAPLQPKTTGGLTSRRPLHPLSGRLRAFPSDSSKARYPPNCDVYGPVSNDGLTSRPIIAAFL
jgi:hypothetical protein